MIYVIETKAVYLVRRAVELAETTCEPAPVDEDERVARVGAADADGLASHIVRAHLDVLFCCKCIGEGSCPLAVEIGTGDDGLRLWFFLEHFLIDIRSHVNVIGGFPRCFGNVLRSVCDGGVQTGKYCHCCRCISCMA